MNLPDNLKVEFEKEFAMYSYEEKGQILRFIEVWILSQIVTEEEDKMKAVIRRECETFIRLEQQAVLDKLSELSKGTYLDWPDLTYKRGYYKALGELAEWVKGRQKI